MPEVMNEGHRIQRARKADDGLELVLARIYPAPEPMHDRIAARVGEVDVDRAEDFALGREVNLGGIVCATQRVPAHIRAVGATRPDARREPGMDQGAVLLLHVVALAAVAPVEAAIWMK